MKHEEQPYAVKAALIAVEKLHRDEHDCVRSLRVPANQSSFVASNDDSLEEAEDNPACVPLIIRAAGKPVGFAMYALDEDDGNYWIYRLMVDARFQGNGYGRAALMQIIRMLAEHAGCSCVVLGVKPKNERARRLYEAVGFRATGDIIEGEIVMRYEV
ncbi:GNAT family N-acetyltransferase [Microvirga rosea]|uniref:GNAT family N-acetyltransferase n=1 Tax=Microvirga rosea TaxID=2715425 RepID=UPI001D0B8B7E|nr:GNAT family N-acetyltransferase [Microvirga rosea]MCB8819938.1 GNAT family N-acetyltransferase [Microvirga rosea]